ncbi:hypothetical protein BC332_03845 [Capsicum chinense]|nr:hypothetical protein BC332_03845 [Capsicum chinense]
MSRVMEKKLQKERKEHSVKELKNMMCELLEGINIPTEIHPCDLYDLCFVMNENLKKTREVMKKKTDEEGSTFNNFQLVVGLMKPDETSFEGPTSPLLDPSGGPI